MASALLSILLLIAFSMLGGVAAAAGKAVDGVVNLNTAQPEVLLLLPGVGLAKVERIIAYRRRRPFRTVDELVRVKGIGRKMVRSLRAHLAVSGPTTASAAVAGAAPRAGPPAPPPAPPPRPAPAPARAAGGPPPPAKPSAPGPRPPPRAPMRPAAHVPASAGIPLTARASCLRPP